MKEIESGGHKLRREAPEKFFWAPHFSFGPPPTVWRLGPFSFAGNELAVEISQVNTVLSLLSALLLGDGNGSDLGGKSRFLRHRQPTSVPRW